MAAAISLSLPPPLRLSSSSSSPTAVLSPPFFPTGAGGAHGTSPLLLPPRRRRPHITAAAADAASNGDPYRNAKIGGRMYRRMGSSSCLVVAPPHGRKPRAVVKFLGGAFIGAVPELTYSYLIELLAKEGYLVVSVPYNVTFDHAEASREVYEKFHYCMEKLSSSGLPDANLTASDLAGLPFYSVGHSNGALLQLLVGSYYSEKIPKANVVISFNNKPASEAVPYFEQLGPLVSQVTPIVEVNPVISMARNASGDAWKALVNTAESFVRSDDKEALFSLTKFVDQLPSVMNQVSQGTSEFRPTPTENREFFRLSYNIPHTLLVKFSADPIDESDSLEEILRPRVESTGGTLEKVALSGTHITPCLQDVRWDVGDQYTPADAIAQGVKSLTLNDTKVLARTVARWLEGIER